MATKEKKFTSEDRELQHKVLTKYRDEDKIPPINEIARKSGVSVSTAHYFMQGNSRSEQIRDVLRAHIREVMNQVPDDLSRLIEIWDLDKD